MSEGMDMIYDTLDLMSGRKPAGGPQISKGVSDLISMLTKDKREIEAALIKLDTGNFTANLYINFLPVDEDDELTVPLYGYHREIAQLLKARLAFLDDRLSAANEAARRELAAAGGA